MPRSVFPYPGGKSRYADWIIQQFPEHYCYVEVFGGAGGVLANKPRSQHEVYNDIDGDVVAFFDVLAEQGDDLVERLKEIPYSRETHQQWATEWYPPNPTRPDDPVERAARYFFFRNTQYAAVCGKKSGFRTSSSRNMAQAFDKSIEELHTHRERFRRVVVENRDYSEIFGQYDSPETLFYCDPPYLNVGDDLYSHEGEFDHEEFVGQLGELDGNWVISYSDLPDGLEQYQTKARSRVHKTKPETQREATERLVMNFAPDDLPSFRDACQQGLEAFGEVSTFATLRGVKNDEQ